MHVALPLARSWKLTQCAPSASSKDESQSAHAERSANTHQKTLTNSRIHVHLLEVLESNRLEALYQGRWWFDMRTRRVEPASEGQSVGTRINFIPGIRIASIGDVCWWGVRVRRLKGVKVLGFGGSGWRWIQRGSIAWWRWCGRPWFISRVICHVDVTSDRLQICIEMLCDCYNMRKFVI